MTKQPGRTILGLYNAAWTVFRPFLRMSKRLGKGYKKRLVPPDWLSRPVNIWIQAASAGEARLAEELIRELPGPADLLLTSITDQGMSGLAKAADWAAVHRPDLSIQTAYFPFDAPILMSKALRQAAPRLIVLLETELWPGLMSMAAQAGIPIIVVNARMSPRSLSRYLPLAKVFQAIRPAEVMAVSKADAARFALLFSMEQVNIMPNIKLDRLCRELDAPPEPADLSLLFAPEARIIVLGSIRQPEEPDIEKMLKILCSDAPEAVIALCPRHIHRLEHWQSVLRKTGRPWRMRSSLSPNQPAGPGSIVLWDIFGELPQTYALARAAFVGGSLKKLGGQNFLEALAAGLVPCSGLSWHNFSWVGEEIIKAGLLKTAPGVPEAAELLLEQFHAPRDPSEVRRELKDYLSARTGGAAAACSRIAAFLSAKNQTEPYSRSPETGTSFKMP